MEKILTIIDQFQFSCSYLNFCDIPKNKSNFRASLALPPTPGVYSNHGPSRLGDVIQFHLILWLVPFSPPRSQSSCTVGLFLNESTLRISTKYWSFQIQRQSFQLTPGSIFQDDLGGPPCSPSGLCKSLSKCTKQFKCKSKSQHSILSYTSQNEVKKSLRIINIRQRGKQNTHTAAGDETGIATEQYGNSLKTLKI